MTRRSWSQPRLGADEAVAALGATRSAQRPAAPCRQLCDLPLHPLRLCDQSLDLRRCRARAPPMRRREAVRRRLLAWQDDDDPDGMGPPRADAYTDLVASRR